MMKAVWESTVTAFFSLGLSFDLINSHRLCTEGIDHTKYLISARDNFIPQNKINSIMNNACLESLLF